MTQKQKVTYAWSALFAVVVGGFVGFLFGFAALLTWLGLAFVLIAGFKSAMFLYKNKFKESEDLESVVRFSWMVGMIISMLLFVGLDISYTSFTAYALLMLLGCTLSGLIVPGIIIVVANQVTRFRKHSGSQTFV